MVVTLHICSPPKIVFGLLRVLCFGWLVCFRWLFCVLLLVGVFVSWILVGVCAMSGCQVYHASLYFVVGFVCTYYVAL